MAIEDVASKRFTIEDVQDNVLEYSGPFSCVIYCPKEVSRRLLQRHVRSHVSGKIMKR